MIIGKRPAFWQTCEPYCWKQWRYWMEPAEGPWGVVTSGDVHQNEQYREQCSMSSWTQWPFVMTILECPWVFEIHQSWSICKPWMEDVPCLSPMLNGWLDQMPTLLGLWASWHGRKPKNNYLSPQWTKSDYIKLWCLKGPGPTSLNPREMCPA